MNKNFSLLLWAIFYGTVVYFLYEESIKFNSQTNGAFFLENSLFRIQKFFFNINIFFTMYIFIMKKPFTSPTFLIRCQNQFLKYVINYGIRISLLFLIFTLCLHIGIPLLKGTNLVFKDVITGSISLFIFIFFMYLFYLYVLLRSNKQILSLLSVFVINFLTLVIYNAISFNLHLKYNNELELNFLTFLLSIISIILIINIKITESKDQLN